LEVTGTQEGEEAVVLFSHRRALGEPGLGLDDLKVRAGAA
jgi:hypothetical protein